MQSLMHVYSDKFCPSNIQSWVLSPLFKYVVNNKNKKIIVNYILVIRNKKLNKTLLIVLNQDIIIMNHIDILGHNITQHNGLK